MTEKITRGDGWNVFLSGCRLFIVEVATGTRRADFEVDEKLLDALRKALKTVEEKTVEEKTKKKTTRKKATE